MESWKRKICSTGYWTGEVENEAGALVSILPKVVNACVYSNEDWAIIGTDNLSQTIYQNANNVLKLVNNDNEYPIEKVKIQKLCDIDILPKKNTNAQPFPCSVYHVAPQDHMHINFFYITHNDSILSYARFHIKQNQKITAPAYNEQTLLTVEAMETYQRGTYSFGTVLTQMIHEYSINNGFDGRVALYSVNDSGQFYYKMGYTPLESSVYSQINAGHHMDGKIMFLTDAAIDQWRIRASQNPILLKDEKILHLHTNELSISPVSTGGMFAHDNTSPEISASPRSSTPNVTITKK